MPVMRSLWPGINGNATGSSFMVSNMRKRATQASRFMVQMMQAPLYYEETAPDNENDNGNHDASAGPSSVHESGEEGLAIRIASEVFIHSFLFSTFIVLSLTNISVYDTFTSVLVLFNAMNISLGFPSRWPASMQRRQLQKRHTFLHCARHYSCFTLDQQNKRLLS